MERISEEECPKSTFQSEDKCHGRLEKRIYTLFKAEHLPVVLWSGLSQFVKVDRERIDIKTGLIQNETSFYMTSLTTDNIEKIARIIRGHWGIENRLHYVKDVIQGEDDNKIAQRNKAENLSIMKNISLNIYRKNGFDSIKYAVETLSNKIYDLFEYIIKN